MRQQQVLFTPLECQHILQLAVGQPYATKIYPEVFEKNLSTTHNRSAKDLPRFELRRRTTDTDLDKTITELDITGKQFLEQKLSNWITSITQECNLLSYVKGDFLYKHIDAGVEGSGLAKRQYTMIIQLSDPADYEGGTFVIGDYHLPKTQGLCCLFDGGTQVHEVLPITSGTRLSMITWFEKDDLIL
jgi:predicted 2-oxoglutarate/Fe(II)-dependent dioxygenase YbiX